MRSLRYFHFFALFIISSALFAAPHFPPLTGRVVDNAHVLSQNDVASLDAKLAAYENGTSNQVVVVTVPSLQGYAIEDFGYQLGRYWQIGQKDKNNGVLLIVAPKERKVRIEVGYGLEPVLTDAASSIIINDVILPNFKAGQMALGIKAGTQSILDVLGGKSITPAHQKSSDPNVWFVLFLLFILFVRQFPGFLLGQVFRGSSRSGGGFLSGGSGGSGGFGGFGGGGGSFGGGGSSGSW